MAQMILDEPATVTLDGSGNGTAKVGPASGQMWQLASVTVSTISQTAPLPQCKMYAGPQPQPSWQIDATFTGNGDSTGRAATLYPGNYVWAVWTGGNPGDTATMRALGTVNTNYRDQGPLLQQAATGSGFSNDAVGGTTLVRPAIQSPNFSETGQTGWAIEEDGDAFFFNLTAAGSILGGNITGANISGSTIEGSSISGSSVTADIVIVESVNAGVFVYALV